MSLFNLFKKEKRYRIVGWYGREHLLTASELYERVMKDCESDYNWIASATELVRVCNEPDFPQEYAQAIKIAILDCFANVEIKKEYPSNHEPTDVDAVYFCYNSLAGTSVKADEVRQKYVKAIIVGVSKYHFRLLEFKHHGPIYFELRDNWIKAKFEEYGSISEPNFEELCKTLHDDYDKTMKTAEADGAFQEDDEKINKEMKEFWSSLNLGHI